MIPTAALLSYIHLFHMTYFLQEGKPVFEIKLFFWEIEPPEEEKGQEFSSCILLNVLIIRKLHERVFAWLILSWTQCSVEVIGIICAGLGGAFELHYNTCTSTAQTGEKTKDVLWNI